MLYDAIKRVSPGYYQHDIQAHWNIFKSSGDNPTGETLNPEIFQGISRYFLPSQNLDN